MAQYVEEFLYRGRAPGDGRDPAWHVVLGESVTQFGRDKVVLSDPLSMADAAALGWDLPAVIAAINAEALAEAEMLRAEKRALEAGLAAREFADNRDSDAAAEGA